MSGLLRRIRRPGAAEENRTEAVALPEPAHGSAPETAPVRADGSPLPAGVAPEDLERRSGTARRGKMRRRVRFLRRARELALRDLGGLVYEAARRDQDGTKLVQEKVVHLGVIDSELRVLEAELGAPRGETVLREPGVGGTCPRCGELHASDAHFCSRCALDLTAVPAPEPAEAAAPAASEPAAAEPADASAEEPADASAAEAGETSAAEQPHRESKRWWRRRPPAKSEANVAEPTGEGAARAETGGTTAAEPAGRGAAEAETGEATVAEPAGGATTEAETADTPVAEPAAATSPAAEGETPIETPGTEQPTTVLETGPHPTGNGRATKQDAPDHERST
jgi:hypothetical protein